MLGYGKDSIPQAIKHTHSLKHKKTGKPKSLPVFLYYTRSLFERL